MDNNFKLFLEAWEDEKKFINLKSVIKATEEDIIKYLDENASHKAKKSWLFIPPNSKNRICLVAHIDRIFAGPQKKKVLNKKGVWTSPQGISGDDRCGVYALFHIWRTLPAEHRPMLLFTHEEETGLIGAQEAARTFKKQLKDVTFFIELDRKGSDDMVFYNWEHIDYPEFMQYIGKHGFKHQHGSTSDVKVLGDKLNKASVNLSMGYYKQHSKEEYIIVKQMLDTIKKVKNICIANEPLPPMKPKPKYTPREYKEYKPYTPHKTQYSKEEWAEWEKKMDARRKARGEQGREVTRGYSNEPETFRPKYKDVTPFWEDWDKPQETFDLGDFNFKEDFETDADKEKRKKDIEKRRAEFDADVEEKKKKREKREEEQPPKKKGLWSSLFKRDK